MSENGFEYGSPEEASTHNGCGVFESGLLLESTYPTELYRTTAIYDDRIDSVDLGALIIQGKEAGENAGE